MIVYYFIKILIGILKVIVSPLLFLSDASISVNLANALASAGNYVALLDAIFPVSTLFVLFGIYIAIETGYFTYKLIRWVYRKIPGVS